MVLALRAAAIVRNACELLDNCRPRPLGSQRIRRAVKNTNSGSEPPERYITSTEINRDQ